MARSLAFWVGKSHLSQPFGVYLLKYTPHQVSSDSLSLRFPFYRKKVYISPAPEQAESMNPSNRLPFLATMTL